jgi:hypothetical protein
MIENDFSIAPTKTTAPAIPQATHICDRLFTRRSVQPMPEIMETDTVV